MRLLALILALALAHEEISIGGHPLGFLLFLFLLNVNVPSTSISLLAGIGVPAVRGFPYSLKKSLVHYSDTFY